MDSACMLSVSDEEIPRRLVWVFSFWSAYDQNFLWKKHFLFLYLFATYKYFCGTNDDMN